MSLHLTVEEDLEGYKYVNIGSGYIVFKGQAKPCDQMVSGFVTEDIDIAALYTEDGNLCCFKFKTDVKLFLMDEDNIKKLLKDENILKITKDGEQISHFLQKVFLDQDKYRNSSNVYDYIVTRTLCKYLWDDKGYAGYYAPSRISNTKVYKLNEKGEKIPIPNKFKQYEIYFKETIFPREIALCNAEKVLIQCNKEEYSLSFHNSKAKLEDDFVQKQIELLNKRNLDLSITISKKGDKEGEWLDF